MTMTMNNLGRLFPVSRLALGGGGIGQVWGETNRSEAEATVKRAYDLGINLFDMAPSYGDGEAESVLGSCFGGAYADDIRVTTKCMLGSASPNSVEGILADSLEASLKRLKRDQIDVLILHGYVVDPEDFSADKLQRLAKVVIPINLYRETVVPLLNAWKQSGKIGAWGMTAAGVFETDREIINAQEAPDVIQCISNVLDSAGDMGIKKEAHDCHRERIKTAHEQGIGTMGIRAVAAGALCDDIDREIHPKSRMHNDFARAEKFRAIAKAWHMSAAQLAHRYALSMSGIDTVVLGVKNRAELDDCIAAAEAPSLTESEIAELDLAVAI